MNSPLMEIVRRTADETPGRLGCHICDPAGNVWASLRADERFATASVIKIPILLALAASVDAGERRWDDVVHANPGDSAAGSGVIQYLYQRGHEPAARLACNPASRPGHRGARPADR